MAKKTTTRAAATPAADNVTELPETDIVAGAPALPGTDLADYLDSAQRTAGQLPDTAIVHCPVGMLKGLCDAAERSGQEPHGVTELRGVCAGANVAAYRAVYVGVLSRVAAAAAAAGESGGAPSPASEPDVPADAPADPAAA